jgi:hypothetical protein
MSRRSRPIRVAVRIALAAVLAFGAGCATVRPYEKEALADPVMSFRADAAEASEELHWLEAREGSTGGAGGAAGGCACN